MAKDDVRVVDPLAWDAYKDKLFGEALPAVYFHAVGVSKIRCDWYWKSIKSKRRASIGILMLTLILLIVGTVLPILAGLRGTADQRLQFTQLAVGALAFAGLLQVADRIFGWSSGWLRYMTTVTAMENLTRKFELDWASYIVDKGSNLGSGDIKPLFDLATKFEDDTAKLQSDETDKWVAEFSSSVALLGEMIRSQREAGQKHVEAAQATVAAQQKAQQKGAVELNISCGGTPQQVSISIDNETAQQFLGSTWARLDLQPGLHTITITAIGATPHSMQKVVDVPPGGVAKMEVKLP